MTEQLSVARESPEAPAGEDSLKAFAAEIDAIRARAEAMVGPGEVAYIKRLAWLARGLEILGRFLILISPGPITFILGVLSLWVYRQLQAQEIGHTVLHGTFDKLPGAEAFHAERFRWHVPLNEEAWRYSHNLRHHSFTNIPGKDPDLSSTLMRFTARIPHRFAYYFQVLSTLFVLLPNFGLMVSLHYGGLATLRTPEFLAHQTPEWLKANRRRALRKLALFYGKEYVLLPGLAALLGAVYAWKLILGTLLASFLANVYTGITNLCGHVGDVPYWPPETKAHGKGEWYKLQVESTMNYEVPLLVSILCGALDRQIEHHLFPRLPTTVLRAIAPDVRAACAAHGVRYKTASWPRTILDMFRHIRRLSSPSAQP